MIISSTRREASAGDDSKRRVAEARAKRYLSEGWLPVVPDILREIRRGLREGIYGDAKAVIGDICRDPALFNYCLREVQSDSARSRPGKDIFERLVEVPVAEWSRLLPSLESRASPHKLLEATEPQLMLLRQMGIAASATEALSQKSSMKPLIGFQASFVRQLGLLLVAFNYPRIFAKSWEAHSANPRRLDESLFRALGYSPLKIGVHVAEEWGISEEMRDAVGDVKADEWVSYLTRSAVDSAVSTPPALRDLCCLGEGFAALHARGNGTRTDAGLILEQELQRRLGEDCYQALIEETTDWCERYSPTPTSSKSATTEPASNKDAEFEVAETTIGAVSDRCRDIAARVVKELAPHGASAAALRIIVEELIPAAEFDCGCIYVIERDSLMPRPQLVIGIDRTLFRPVFEYSLGLTVDPMTRACVERSTVRGQVLHGAPSPTLYVAAPLGGDGKRAALYLESSATAYLDGVEKIDVVFELICDLLAAALNLSGAGDAKPAGKAK